MKAWLVVNEIQHLINQIVQGDCFLVRCRLTGKFEQPADNIGAAAALRDDLLYIRFKIIIQALVTIYNGRVQQHPCQRIVDLMSNSGNQLSQ